MRETRAWPEPIVVEGRFLHEITEAIMELREQGVDHSEIRLHAGTPKDWEGDRWAPGYRYCGVLVV